MSFALVYSLPADAWRESTVADFADGFFNANVFVSNEGLDSGSLKSAPGAFYDLNKDGRPDLVICNLEGSHTYIYWGQHDWSYSSAHRQMLPSSGSTGNSIDDIDRDGNLDILVSNYYGGFSTIYWGSKNGYTEADTTLLQASGGHGNSIVDLNHDGALDLLVSSMNGTQAYIFWGNRHNRRYFTRTTLGGFSSSDVAVADLNKDGVLDIVVPNKQGNYPPAGGAFTFNIPSYIYYGQRLQDSVFYNDGAKDSLPTHGTYCVSIGDVNKDGWLDIVFSNHRNDVTYNVNSYIYWGGPGGFSAGNRTELETHSAIGNAIVDLDRDGNLDLIFANWYNDVSHRISSYVYWGPDFVARTELPTNGAHGALVGKLSSNNINDVLITNSYGGWSYIFHGVSRTGYLGYDSIPSSYGHISTKDNGNVHNRDNKESYLSSVFGNGSQEYEWLNSSWTSQVPDGSDLAVYLRTGNTPDPDDGTWSSWAQAPYSGGQVSVPNAPYAQYQLIKQSNDFFEMPALEEISFDYNVLTGAGAGTSDGEGYITMSLIPKYKGVDINYSIKERQRVTVSVYSLYGALVSTLCNGSMDPGSYTVKWDGRDRKGGHVSSGIYICRVACGSKSLVKRVPLIK
jgi:hypothetical protein